MNEVLAQKITSLQRCIARAREARAEAGADFRASYNLQDAALLNVIRACDIAIDLANMLIRRQRLGIPGESRESFTILSREKIIPLDLGERLQRMVGFRNIAVHQYRDLDMEIVETVITRHLDDLLELAQTIRVRMNDEPPTNNG
ncbi:MAG: type VII toxin-antitoxin system HepT family RNase toxin [Steroidobacteraceae bacterium]